MWLFDSKFHKTFLGVTIDREWCETHERSDINTHLHYQAWTPNTLETQLTKVCCICLKEVLQAHSIYTCLICSMLVYEQMRLRLMQCKCPKSKPNTWGVTMDMGRGSCVYRGQARELRTDGHCLWSRMGAGRTSWFGSRGAGAWWRGHGRRALSCWKD
jgi:hypothetical protein